MNWGCSLASSKLSTGLHPRTATFATHTLITLSSTRNPPRSVGLALPGDRLALPAHWPLSNALFRCARREENVPRPHARPRRGRLGTPAHRDHGQRAGEVSIGRHLLRDIDDPRPPSKWRPARARRFSPSMCPREDAGRASRHRRQRERLAPPSGPVYCDPRWRARAPAAGPWSPGRHI